MKNIILQVFIGISLNLIAILCLSMPTQAQKTLILSDEQSKYPLGAYIKILEDPGGNLSINDVTSTEYETRFIPCQKKNPNFGFTGSAYWVRFRVRNETTTNIQQWRLALGFANMHYVDLYKPSLDGRDFNVIRTGTMRPVETREVPFHRFVFKLSLPNQTEQTIFLRFKSSASMTLPLTLWSMEAFNQNSLYELFLLGTFIGILIIMIIYNTFIFFSLRDKSYLYYVLSVFVFLMFVLSQRGLAYQYLWPNLIWWNHLTVPLFNGLLLIFCLIFTDTFLCIKAQFRRLHQLIKVLLAILGILIILIPFTNYGIIIQPIVLLSTFTTFILFAAGFRSWRQGYGPARFFLFSMLIAIITGFIASFVRFGIIPSNLFTEYGVLFGIILLVGLLSLALADRINLLKVETEKINLELRKGEEKYRHIFENIQDVYYEIDLDGVIIEISPSVEQLLLYKSNELIGKSFSLFYANPSTKEKFFNKIIESGTAYSFETTLKNKDGGLLFVASNSILLRDEQGRPLKIVGSLHDLTERKKLEDRLIHAQKMESIGTLAGGIAHDFNNSLTAIMGNAEIALLKLGENHSSSDNICGILKSGENASNLTRQLLGFSRKQIIEPKVLDVNNVISDCNKMLHRLIEEDISIEMILYSGLPKIKADPAQIEQILINLVVNARDAINQKKGRDSARKITIETSYLYLDESYISQRPESTAGPHILISVCDNGIGMDEKIRNKIFDPFFTTKELGRGTGLGLATVYGIVKQNNGSIEVYSEPNDDTMFKIYWPSTDKEILSEIKNEAVKKDDLTGHESILLVEDNSSVKDYAKEALTKFGYHVYAAQNGMDALELIKVKKIQQVSMLVTDMIMPEMNGRELASRVKEIFPEIKILYISGYTNNHITNQGILKEGIHLINKPFSITTLIKGIRKVLDNA